MNLLSLNVYVLGTPRLELNRSVLNFDTRKATALMVYLTVTGEGQTRDSLAAFFWPDYSASNARAALRRTLSSIRSQTGDEVLETIHEQVGIHTKVSVWVDASEFQVLMNQVSAHHPRDEIVCHECIERLNQATRLYRGAFLSGFGLRDSPSFDDWTFFQAESYRQECSRALERLAHALVDRREYEAAIAAARRWSALDPLLEDAHRLLMQLYAWSGQRNAALRQYRECVRILEQQLSVPPLEETTALYHTILENRPLPPLQRAQEAENPLRQAQFPAMAAAHQTQEDHLPHLVGRADHLAQLDQAYRSAQPDGYVISLEGEVGIGKTSLAQAFISRRLSDGAMIFQANCYEGETNLAYAPWILGLERLFEDESMADRARQTPTPWLLETSRLLPTIRELLQDQLELPPLDNPGAQSRFFEGVRQTLVSMLRGRQPGIIFLDDLHWADSASLELLAYIQRRLLHTNTVLMFTWREDDVVSAGWIRNLLSEAIREGKGLRLALQRLNEQQVAELAEAYQPSLALQDHSFVHRLYVESEGLPLFMMEYLHSLQGSGETAMTWSMPRSIRELLKARLGRLDETARQLLSSAAIIGRSFDFSMLREISGRSEIETISGLEDLLEHGLIVESQPGAGQAVYDFTHEKLRACVYDETSAARRRLLHLRAAEALANSLRSQREGHASITGLTAQHYRLAGQDEMAAEFFYKAGEQARAVFANQEALGHFQSALACGYNDTCTIHEAVGDLYILIGDYSAALTSLEKAAAICHATDLPRLDHKLGYVHARRGAWELAICHYQSALDEASLHSQLVLQASIYVDWSLAAQQLGQPALALELAQRALVLAEQANASEGSASVYNLLGILARKRGELDQARQYLERSLFIARQIEHPGAQAAALNNLALVCTDRNEIAQAIDFTVSALDLCDRMGDRHHAAALHNNLADLYHLAGQPEAAMAQLKQAVMIFAEIGDTAGEMQAEIWKLTEW